MPIHTPKTYEEFEKLVNDHPFIVVDFFAQWCGPCKVLGENLKSRYTDDKNVHIVKVDVDNDEFTKLSETCKVTALPFVVFFVDGKIQAEHVVGNNLKQIITLIDKFKPSDETDVD